MNVEKWLSKNTQSLCGKKIAVTGSTGGLGRELCFYLAKCGAELLLLDRNRERSEEHKRALCEKFSDLRVECVNLDLESLASVDHAAEVLIEREIDVFVHNAGAYSIPRRKCDSGYDNVFCINFAHPYYIVRKILPMLRARGGKVVAVGSIAHNYSKIDEHDADFSTRLSAAKVYGNSKRYLMFGLWELFRAESKAKLCIAHPGISFTNITAHYPRLVFAVIKHPMKLIFMKPRVAVLSVLKAVFDDGEYGEWIGPHLFDVWGLPRKRRLSTCSKDECERIAQIAHGVYSHLETTLEKQK